jgi:hypothetical protein
MPCSHHSSESPCPYCWPSQSDYVPTPLEALKLILPLAEAYLAQAPSHPDHAKLESARAAIAQAKGE